MALFAVCFVLGVIAVPAGRRGPARRQFPVRYVLDVLAPLVPLPHLPQYRRWTLAQYVRATDAPTGWGWAGGMLPSVGIAVLAGALRGVASP